MLTKSQIQRLAQRANIGLQAQERDYLQHLLLFLLYRRSQALIFKGGTAIRLVHRGNRYSEDLDFNSQLAVESLASLWQKTVEHLLDFGIEAEVRNAWQSEVGYSFDVSYQGPLFDGRPRTKGKVRVDINLRYEEVEAHSLLVNSPYEDLRPFVVTVLKPEHLFAEKVRALLARGKARDLYDIWFLMQQGIFGERELIERKLLLYDLELTSNLWNEAVQKAAQDWERDLRPLLPQWVGWAEVAGQLGKLEKLFFG